MLSEILYVIFMNYVVYYFAGYYVGVYVFMSDVGSYAGCLIMK